jgi:hypothetical protein
MPGSQTKGRPWLSRSCVIGPGAVAAGNVHGYVAGFRPTKRGDRVMSWRFEGTCVASSSCDAICPCRWSGFTTSALVTWPHSVDDYVAGGVDERVRLTSVLDLS